MLVPIKTLGFPDGTALKNPSADTADARDAGSIPVLGRSPGTGNDNPPSPISILAWKIPWPEEPGGLQSMGSQRVRPG